MQTKQDIFYLLNNYSSSTSNKFRTIVNEYKQLIGNNFISINCPLDIRNIYDLLLKEIIDKSNLPDGKLFRKDSVSITDGINEYSTGLYPEENIIKSLDELIKFVNDKSINIYERLIIFHILFELIHPFYDGNGRIGRFIFSSILYSQTNSLTAFVISAAINKDKSKYYKIFKEATNIHQFGCLNYSFSIFSSLLESYLINLIKELESKKELLNKDINISYSKSENKIINLLKEATIFSDFGLSYSSLIKETKLSKRTIIYVLNKLDSENLLIRNKYMGCFYFKLNSI